MLVSAHHRNEGINEYVEMMREKDRKAKEATELKQKRKEERERKKAENEIEREKKRREQEEKNKKGQGKGKGQRQSSSESGEQSNEETHPILRSTRLIRAPQCYRDDTADSDNNNTLRILCYSREPPVSDGIVFWVDCDRCGE